MENLNNFIYNKLNTPLWERTLSECERSKLLYLDRQYKDIFIELRNGWDETDVIGLLDEWEKFKTHHDKGEKYFPKIRLVVNKISDDYVDRCRKLSYEFSQFQCYLSKFYIERINEHLLSGEWLLKRNISALKNYLNYNCPRITDEQYEDALKMLKEHPFKDKKKDQIYSAKDVLPKIQAHIEKLGYEYEVVLNPCMIARMNVIPNAPSLQVRSDAKFSDVDIESLKVHEVEVHTGRRYYGMKQGLYFMLDGFAHRNTLDEGLAIYNSIHKNPLGVKPNLFFEIAIKTVIAYHIYEKDFCELYDFLCELCPEANEKVIFENIMRFKRSLMDSKILGGNALPETDYFLGYRLVQKLDEKTRKDIIKYNIGPEHLDELDHLKIFFKNNKFESIVGKLPSKDPYSEILKDKGLLKSDE